MYPVSERFKETVYANRRMTDARVVFEVLDIDAWENNSKTASSEATISRLDQTTNKNRGMSRKYATLEKNYWALDGSFFLPPEPNESPDLELGWWSGVLCGEDGTFDPHQTLTFDFTKDHSSMGISVAFDDAANEFAAEFDINIYNSGDTLIYSESVTGNTTAKYVWMEQLNNYRKVELVIKRWAKPYRRARVVEVDFGVVKEYAGRKLYKLNLLQEVDLTSSTLPASEAVFTVDNSDQEFNFLNPQGFYRYLQERQEVFVEMGVEVYPDVFEYLKTGKYYLYDWRSEDDDQAVTFIAQDIFRILDDYEFESQTANSQTLYDLAVEVFTAAGIEDYEIDPALQSITTQAIYRKMTGRNLMQHICMAGRCNALTDREGRPCLKRLQGTQPVSAITFDNTYQEPRAKLDKLISAVEVNIYDNGSVDDVYVLANGPKGEVYRIDNPLINDSTTAQAVAEWVLSILNQRALHEVSDWMQNPALDLGDIVAVENVYGPDAEARIYRTELIFDGALEGRTELRGEIGGG